MEKEIEASRVVAKEQDALDALQAKRTAMRADAERFTQSINDLRNDFKTVFGKAFTSRLLKQSVRPVGKRCQRTALNGRKAPWLNKKLPLILRRQNG